MILEHRPRMTPPRLLLISFLALIAFGTLGLRTIPGLYVGVQLGWVDALFTATSAVCVTGLIVVDTATHFTLRGQAFLLLLIQLGGLGILTFTTLIIQALGRRLSLHHEAVASSYAEIAPQLDFRKLVRSIVVLTLLFEAIGATVLFVAWRPRFGAGEAAWHAGFQSISAFCNAGFSTFSDSLTGFQRQPLVLGVVMTLIVAGGLGFLVFEELRHVVARRRGDERLRLSLHTRLVLQMSAVLLAGGWATFTVLEWTNALGSLPAPDRLVNSLFMSVTARTAGFNTVDYSATTVSSNFATILLMSIGGSPGSTAGGLKTTTVALIGLLALARLRGRTVTGFGYRTIPAETVQRAVGLFVVAFGLVTGAILLLAVLELGPGGSPSYERFLGLMFEAVSAFNTVGLSMGETGGLSDAGRLLTVFLMYVGRVGPLSFAAAIAFEPDPGSSEFRYAHEDVIIG